MHHILRRIIEHFFRQRTLRPVASLMPFRKNNAKIMLDQRAQPDLLQPEQLSRQRGVKKRIRLELADPRKQTKIEVASMHHQRKISEQSKKRVEIEAGRESVDQDNFLPPSDLARTDPPTVGR